MKTIQPRKQHKMLLEAPSHIRSKLFSAPLSPTLSETHKVGSIPVRTGDTVRIMRGDKKGVEGKITRVDRRKYRLFVEGITREKVDGSAIPAPIHPSKVMVTSLNLDDKRRRESLKVEAPKEPEKAEAPAEERKKRSPSKAPPKKRARAREKAPRKRRPKKSEEKKEGEAETG